MPINNNEAPQLPDRYRAKVPFSTPDPTHDGQDSANWRHIEQKHNELPVDTACLWLGGGSTVSALNSTDTATLFDGHEYLNDGFTIDPVANTVTVLRSGFYEVSPVIRYAHGTPQANGLIVEVTNNHVASPYPSPTERFISPVFVDDIVAFHTLAPLWPGDLLQILAHQGSGSAVNVTLENLFIRWARPYI